MKNLKSKLIILSAISILSIGSAATVLAADYPTPADIAASVTGKAVAEVIQERIDTGKTYGAIAAEAGKLEEFKEEMLNTKEEMLREDVENGVISQQEADDTLNTIKERQAICDGTGCGLGYGSGCGFGSGRGAGRGCGAGLGRGRGSRNGSCIY